ncbi:hypothetical protein ACFOY2_26805 [Nonomuraea purpurea]|uniref:Uncharacterized protein n=1 Tax=Nonomuraea purpurea TaxID=1849276 RepID=A0ABV8GA49_9ACTN
MLNGTRGGLVAGTLFVLPGMLALLVLSAVYVLWQDTDVVTALFVGIARRCWPSSGLDGSRK